MDDVILIFNKYNLRIKSYNINFSKTDKVILLNDDFTPMEFVVHILEKFFGITHDLAINIMLTVHQKGLAVIGVFSHDVAESKVNQVMTYSRKNQHPLQCTMEKE